VARINCNDDNCGLQSQLSFFAEAGVTYYFIVHGYSLSSGVYAINVTGVAGGVRPNDNCAGVLNITTLPYTDVGSTLCANDDFADCLYGSANNDVVYGLQLESCFEATISLCGSEYDTGLELRTGGFSCPGTISLACNDDYCGYQSQIQTRILSNRPYWIIVHGFLNSAGPYILNVTGVTCTPESLVVQRQTNNAYLDWAPVASTGTMMYHVYRATTPDVQPIPANLIGTTSNAFYTDLNVINNPQIKYFYAVTAEGPALLEQPQPVEPAVAMEADKNVTAAELDAMQSVMIPTYLDPNWIGAPNPNKPEDAETGANESGSWYGTLAPLPDNQQVKQ
jgi:hypothetical protein